MRSMIEGLVELSAMDRGEIRLQLDEHDASEMAREAVDLIRPIATDSEVRIEAASTSEHLALRCDRNRLLQVLSNLLGNAVRFTHGGAITVRVSTADDDDTVRFSVADTGRGIPAAQLPF